MSGVVFAEIEELPTPIALSARTLMVYGVPLVNEPMTKGLDNVPASTQGPLFSWYSIADIGEPPLSETVNATCTAWFCATSTTVGAIGVVLGPTPVVVEGALAPAALTARTATG